MIDSVEPLSCVLWAVAFFAAGMYPLGFMLGAPCSPCCDPQCGDEPIEFNRCIRFVNTDTSAPPTTYAEGETVSQPLHGFSRAVTRPEQIGAMRVGTKADFTASLTLAASARAMSDGETQSATYRYYYRSGFPTFADVGTAKQWNVTIVGVTRPLTMPTTVEDSALQYQIGPGASNPRPAREYGVGVLADSTSAPVSVTVHSVALLSGSQFLDGNTVTEATLKAMLTATIPLRDGRDWVTRLEFAAASDPFQYVPSGTSISLEYVIKHTRGSQHRFRTFSMSVFKTAGSTVTSIPEGGLAPLSLPQPPYADTPYVVTPATYSDTDPDAVSIYSSDVAGVKSLKTVELVPAGEQLRSDILLAATNSSHVSSSGFTRTNTEFGYIMRPFDPGGGYVFNSFNHPADSPWNYNVAEVEAFLAGGYTLPYNSGTSLVTHKNTWTMEVTEPTQFCGTPLCRGFHLIERSVTCKPGSLPATWQTSTETGTTTHTNQCFGQDDVPEFSMALGLSGGGCLYFGSKNTCQSLVTAMDREPFTFVYSGTAGPGTQLLSRVLDARVFYCGDLLWAIENGPCREALERPPSPGYGSDLFTLGGDVIAARACPSSIAADDTCYLQEVSIDLSSISFVDGSPRFGNWCAPCGSLISNGTPWPGGDPASAEGSFVLPLREHSCNALVYKYGFTVGGIAIGLEVTAVRDNWCEDLYLRFVGVTLTGQPHFFYGTVILGLAFEGNESGGTDRSTHRSCDNPTNSDNCMYTYQPGALMGWWNENNDRNYYTASYSLEGFAESGVEPTNPGIIPYDSSAPAEGGNVSVTVCCPERVEVIAVPPATERYDFTYRVPFSEVGYITREGRGDTYCPFTIEWLSGITVFPFEAGLQMFASERCPIKGQVNHAEQPPCEWSVTSSAAWLIAEKIPEEPELEEGEEDPEPAGDQVGLLKLSINPDDTTVFSGTFRGFGRAFRSATITITSGGTVNTWTIIQLQP